MTSEDRLDEFANLLEDLLRSIPVVSQGISILGSRRRVALRREIEDVISVLSKLSIELDPIEQPPRVFDPSHPEEIARLISTTLLEQPTRPLDSIRKFYGSGVYALYYSGPFKPYRPVRNERGPLYVGKADPASPEAKTVQEQGDRLSRRLSDHAKSIRQAQNLELNHFSCRFLVVRSAWQKTAEEYLINRFKPIWNNEIKTCYGFGKHGDSSKTRRNKRSPWDTIHPGRPWATESSNVPNLKSPKQIFAAIAAHYAHNPPIQDE